MAEKLFYYLWHGFFGALIVAVPLNHAGMLPIWGVLAFSFAMVGMVAACLAWLAVRMLLWR